MTIFEKAIFQAIKEHNSSEERRADLEMYNKGIKFLSMTPASGSRTPYGDTFHYVYPNKDQDDWKTCVKVEDVYMRLEVKCKFRPVEKYENNVVMYEVLVISSGEIVVYFDGTEYQA